MVSEPSDIRFPSIVLAGGLAPRGAPLYDLAGGRPKALIELRGRPMIAYVLAALDASPLISDIHIVGLPPESLLDLPSGARRMPDHGSLVANAVAGLRQAAVQAPTARNVLLCTADLPLLTPTLIAAFVGACRPYSDAFYYPVIARQVMESRFPTSRRTYARLADGEFAGGDLALVQPALLETNHALWEALAAARKHPWRLAGVIGLGVLVKHLMRRLTIGDAERRAEHVLGLPVRAVWLKDPELAMDVDKPQQLALVADALARAAAE